MRHVGSISIAILLSASAASQAQGTATPEKVDPVAVVGCLKEAKPSVWLLVNASEPVASTANAPSAKEMAGLPKGGKREFQLIGVAVFNLASHRDHSVVVKGLPIKATPADRLNVTSVTMLAAVCPAPQGY
jgi:hypothetical protein